VLRTVIAAGLALLAMSGDSPRDRHLDMSSWGARRLDARSRPSTSAPDLASSSWWAASTGTSAREQQSSAASSGRTPRFRLWLLPNLNPDGYAGRHRQNGRGVDLNRNFPSQWRPSGRPWDAEYSGPRPASEPETRIAMRLILRVRPRVTIWDHQHEDLVRAWGGSIALARRYARLVGLPFRRLPWPGALRPTGRTTGNVRLRRRAAGGPARPLGSRSLCAGTVTTREVGCAPMNQRSCA